MESLGGVGYLENEESQHINVARLYRDVNVLSIWEGTTNVLGTDFVRTLKGRNGEKTLKALRAWLRHALNGVHPRSTLNVEKRSIMENFEAFKADVADKGQEELIVKARELMETFATFVIGALMIVDAERDGDAISAEMLKRFAATHGFGGPYKCDLATATAWDSKIVFAAAKGEVAVTARL
jgi:hypothetical protein